MYKEQIAELFSDKEFAEKAFKMTPEELCNVLKEKGIEIDVEEIVEAGQILKDISSRGDELTEEMLEHVAGGRDNGFWAGLAVSLIGGGAALTYLGVYAVAMGVLW